MIRFFHSLLGLVLVFCVFAVLGCTNAPGAAPATPASPDPNREAPMSVELASNAQAQPYDQLIYLSEAELKERLGEPSVVETQAKEATWRYNDLKLHVSLFEDRVNRVDVEDGPITNGLAIGDDEAKVQQLTSQVKCVRRESKATYSKGRNSGIGLWSEIARF